MDIYGVLKKYSNVKLQQMNYMDCEIEYYTADYSVKDNCFLKYYIWDLVKNDYHDLFSWKTYEEFSQFQSRLLEDEFFRCLGDERYNIYIIFIVGKDDYFSLNLQNDFRYARKIILKETEVDNFFISLFPLQRQKNINETKNDTLQQRKLKGTVNDYVQKCILLLQKEIRVRFFLAQNIKKRRNYELIPQEIIKLMGAFMYREEKNESSKSKKERTLVNAIRKSSYIEEICSLNIKKYRRFQRECQIPFKKVNIFFGDNGVGKTSILDAIEFGVTGYNSHIKNKSIRDIEISLQTISKERKKETICVKENNYFLSEKWYGIRAETPEEFNKLFRQYNYFDTRWASAFAIEDEEHVNVQKLQEFLGIDDLEDKKNIILIVLRKIYALAMDDEKYINKLKWKKANNSLYKKYMQKHLYNEYVYDNKDIKENCLKYIEEIEKEFTPISWETVIKEHISKIESVFKLLITTDEYIALKVKKDEIVAIRSVTGEEVSMSKMSTGQKVCLALAFMFALFLSSETAPNVILLDEPVANLDDLHMLNFLDLLRRLALSGTQVFFTTANSDVAKLFRRKFSYLEEDFGFYRIIESEESLRIDCEQYSQKCEEPICVTTIYGDDKK